MSFSVGSPSTRDANPAIELVGVSVRFGAATVLDQLSLSLCSGETTVVLGRSGCGKTTLLRLINGMVLPSSGAVRVDGKATTERDLIQLRRQTGYIIQDAGLLPHYTVARNVGLVPELNGEPAERIRERTEELLNMVGLTDPGIATRFPHQLSGGQRQRVGVARALAADPPLLLCDEPFGALDPITRSELQSEFRRLADQLGKTIVFVTHDVREALVLGDRIVLLEQGTVAVDATPHDFRTSKHAEAIAFLQSIEVEERPG